MAAKWIKHLDGWFCVPRKAASRSGQRLSLVCFLFFPFLSLSTPTNSPELGFRDTQNWRIRKGG